MLMHSVFAFAFALLASSVSSPSSMHRLLLLLLFLLLEGEVGIGLAVFFQKRIRARNNRNSDQVQKKLKAIKRSPTLLSRQKLQMESAMQRKCNAMRSLPLLRVSCVLRSTGVGG
jgi:hypothetical protein